MNKCIQLASKAVGKVSPNPNIGSVIVYKDDIIGQGYHENFGFALMKLMRLIVLKLLNHY